jgi:peptidoglycan/LPS O-acetylase OafA/YrhL
MIILAVLVGTGLALGFSPRDPQRFTWTGLAANLLLLQGWGVGPQLSWNYPSWSVSTEWAGYLAFPFLWKYFGTWRTVIPGQILVVCFPILGLLAYQLAGNSLNMTYALALPRFFVEFIIGMTTMRLVPLNADMMPSRILAWVALGALAMLAGLTDFDIASLVALWIILAALMMRADAERAPVFGRTQVFLLLGRLSYSFYMSFGTVELILAQLFRHEGWDPAVETLPYAAAMTVLTLALAVILHNLVEVPARRLADKWLAEPVLEPIRVTL